MLTTTELAWLLAAVARRDEPAFARLYAATRAKLYGVVFRILRRQDLAEEILQEAYVRIWRNADKFDPAIASPVTWMVAIARNRAIDVARKKTELRLDEENQAMEIASDEPDPLAKREFNEDLQRLLACIGKLDPERQRLVLNAYFNGSSREQLAHEFGRPVNTIKTWLRRSLMDIRECMEQ